MLAEQPQPSNNNALKPNEDIFPNVTVLVVEDNVANFMLIARLLGTLGVKCEWKSSGFEVLEFADTLPKIDLILMDIRLPYEDGYEAYRKLRQSNKYNHIPIVAVTAVVGLDQIHAAQQAGFSGFIGKPLDPDRFPKQIQRILQGEAVWETD